MAELKTRRNARSVDVFLNRIPDRQRRRDCDSLIQLMKSITREEPRMWGDSIVGFGSYHYRYESGREGEMFLTGFSPRKQYLTLYIMSGFSRYESLMKKLGRFKTGKSCLYVKSLDDVDRTVLKELIRKSVKRVAASHR